MERLRGGEARGAAAVTRNRDAGDQPPGDFRARVCAARAPAANGTRVQSGYPEWPEPLCFRDASREPAAPDRARSRGRRVRLARVELAWESRPADRSDYGSHAGVRDFELAEPGVDPHGWTCRA